MVAFKNAMEIFSALDKSNCRKCGEKTCLAFAGAVYCGTRKLHECPHLDQTKLPVTHHGDSGLKRPEENQEEYINQLKSQFAGSDFAEVAKRVGGRVIDDILVLKVLGKRFGVRADLSFATDLHTTPWLVVPLLEYLIHCKGSPVTGEWIPFREIPGGWEKYALFKKRGEDSLKKLADQYTDFFDDIVHMFDGKEVEKQFASDVSVVLQPLPLVPMMICYWKPEDGLESTLNIFFDRSVDANLGLDPLYSLAQGIIQMFEKLALHHGF